MKKTGGDTDRISRAISDCARIVSSLSAHASRIEEISSVIIAALKTGRKVLTAGNGGSCAEAMHMSEELIGRFRNDRPALPAVCLSADPTAITCIGNDYGFDAVFSRQIEALGKTGDILVLFSTSGRSKNLIPALETGKTRGLKVICLLGKDGGVMAGRGDLEIVVKSNATERVQEAHQLILHLVLDAVEEAFRQ